MPDAPPSLDALHDLLIRASKLLDQAATMCRDLDFNPSANIRCMGDAMTRAFHITNQIYRVRPDLAPDWDKPDA